MDKEVGVYSLHIQIKMDVLYVYGPWQQLKKGYMKCKCEKKYTSTSNCFIYSIYIY